MYTAHINEIYVASVILLNSFTRCYVDTLLSLGLGDLEMVSLCWEFMNAAAKTTSTALEWIMARLVLHQVRHAQNNEYKTIGAYM